jgi:hypothetical protein
VDRSSGPKREMRPIPLTEIPLFAGLSDEAKAELRSTCTLREYRASDLILKPGELGAFLFAIAMGTVSVSSPLARIGYPDTISAPSAPLLRRAELPPSRNFLPFWKLSRKLSDHAPVDWRLPMPSCAQLNQRTGTRAYLSGVFSLARWDPSGNVRLVSSS